MPDQLNLAAPGWLPCRCGCGEMAPPKSRIRLDRGDPPDGARYLPGHPQRIDPDRPTKLCSRCRVVKPVEAFYRNRAHKDGRHNHCRECRREVVRTQKQAIKAREKRYGLPPGKFEQLVEQQDGLCAVCGTQPRQMCVDHDHASGKVRGLLCGHCNLGIGKFGDNPVLLRAAADYLDSY